MLVREDHPERAIVAYPPRLRTALVALAGLVMAVVSVVVILISDALRAIVGVLGVLFFGLATGYAVYRIVRPRPVVRVTASGITDTASMVAVGFVPWSRIVDLGVTEFRGQRMISIFVDDPSEIVRRLSPWKRGAARASLRMTGTPVHLPGIALPLPTDMMLDEILLFRPEGRPPP